MRGALPATVVLLVAAGCAGGDSGQQAPQRRERPYAGLQQRDVRALSPQRRSDLLAGRGAGYALAAELNHYPGPMHVLELADELALTPSQRNTARSLEAAMHIRARRLGRQVVAAERALDRLFRSGTATSARVSALTRRAGLLDARLRHLHLDAHVRMRAALTHHQIRRYDELRGYSGPHAAGHGHG